MFPRRFFRRRRFWKILFIIVFAIFVYILFKLHSISSPKSDLEILEEKWENFQEDTKFTEGYKNYELQTVLEEYYENELPVLVTPHLANLTRASIKKYGINAALSDAIPLNRSIPDTRDEECKDWLYPQFLPTASVIIVFYNEPLSILLRTIHSVIDRTPEQLLEEIILIDDYSTFDDLRTNLRLHIRSHSYYKKVKVFKNYQRSGLVRSKNNGVGASVGEVLVYLDAHCEVNVDWLPPLLTEIYKDERTIAVPYIDVIDYFSLDYTANDRKLFKGIFDWGLQYKEILMSQKEVKAREYSSQPHDSPTHSGGLFAINRAYFLKLGLYDPGILIWGGENLELSFKIWQCGGSIKFVPCSRVGHIYRDPTYDYIMEETRNITFDVLVAYNYKRVVEVWLDEKYKKYFYTRFPIARSLNYGDVSEQFEVRKRLNCTDFTWYMENVAYDVLEFFPPPPQNLKWGKMSFLDTNYCIDVANYDVKSRNENDKVKGILAIDMCYNLGRNAFFRLNLNGQLSYGTEDYCIENIEKNTVVAVDCEISNVSGFWKYSQNEKVIYHKIKELCLTLDIFKNLVYLDECNINELNKFQKIWFKQNKI